MPTPTQIRAAIKTVIETVDDVGTVHEYERTASYEGDLWDVFVFDEVHPSTLRGWQIHRAGTVEISNDTGAWFLTDAWELSVFWQVDDGAASEKTFDDAIELVRTAFREDDTLGGVVETLIVDGVAGAQLVETGIVDFGGVPCHAGVLELNTRHCVFS
jgi:hypothetical protein